MITTMIPLKLTFSIIIWDKISINSQCHFWLLWLTFTPFVTQIPIETYTTPLVVSTNAKTYAKFILKIDKMKYHSNKHFNDKIVFSWKEVI